VSVRSAGEVAAAVAGGADIVDAKEPTAGSLGPVSGRVLREIARCVPAGVPLIYEFDTDLNPISKHYLARQSLVAQADLDLGRSSSHDGPQIAQ